MPRPLRAELFAATLDGPAELRSEHPRPQLYRPDWLCLNGEWDFQLDDADLASPAQMLGSSLSGRILVPFAPESARSGIGDPAFHEAAWYRRSIDVPPTWDPRNRVILHFQAVDHDTTVWVGGVEAGRHRGGFTPFSFDITDLLDEQGHGDLVVRARDHRHHVQARGKQATWAENTHAFYTRTTGIWQTVWLESVPALHALRPVFAANADTGTVDVRVPTSHYGRGRIEVELSDEQGVVARAAAVVGRALEPSVRLVIPTDRLRRWRPDDPHLYAARIRLYDAESNTTDVVDSYLGVRDIAIHGTQMLINGEPLFQRLVLDQGYWPETLMTAPSDAALVRDIALGMAAGFTGARVHQKVAEERYLFHADRLGYLVWGEFADWGASGQGPDGDNQRPTASFIDQWADAVVRDRSHPSIVGWCPLNETYQVLHDRLTTLDDVTRAMFRLTKQLDPSRPVIDASGYAHRVPETDVWDSHDYEQDPAAFAANHAGTSQGRPHTNTHLDGRPYSTPYAGQPYMVSEFGGIWWNAERAAAAASGEARDASWGYGERIRGEEEFYERFEGLVRVLDTDESMFGYCYTQLTDVFQEENGIYRFDRTEKLDVARIREIQRSDRDASIRRATPERNSMSRSHLHATAPDLPPTSAERPAVAAASATGSVVISSGQTAHRYGVNIATGLVGRDVDVDLARQCAWQCARNVVTALEQQLGDLDRIAAVLRITVYVASAPGFTDQHLIADAATRYFQTVFGDAGVHARSAIGVAALPTDSPVEVEAIVELRGV